MLIRVLVTDTSMLSYFVVAIVLFSYPYGLESKPQYAIHGVGHYWRDYEGYIPSDALQVSPNMYIAQVFADGIQKPGYIDELQKYAVYLHNGRVYNTQHQVKILCSTDPSQFEWVKTDTSGIMRLLPNRHVIPGGRSKNNKPLFIGRSHDNQVVGMISIYSENDGLSYPLDGKVTHSSEFDVFVYRSY